MAKLFLFEFLLRFFKPGFLVTCQDYVFWVGFDIFLKLSLGERKARLTALPE